MKEAKNKKKKISFGRLFARSFPLSLAGAPAYNIASNLVGIAHGVSHGLSTLVLAAFFNAVTDAVAKQGSAEKAYLYLILVGLVAVAVQVLNGVHNYMTDNVFRRTGGYLDTVIHAKAARIDPVVYENPSHLNDINKAEEGKNASIFLFLITGTLFTFYLPYFLFMGSYLFSLKPVLALSLVIIFVPTALSQFVRYLAFSKFQDKAAPLRRESEYYEQCLCGRELFKETRLLGAFAYFKRHFFSALSLFSKESWKAERRSNTAELIMKACTCLGYGGVLWLLVDALLKKDITAGAFAAVFASVSMMYGIMEEIVSRHIGSIAQSLGAVRNFISYLDLPERTGKGTEPDFSKGISLEDVSFTYPNADKPALSGVNLTVEGGKTLAVVGENGAGKSTLVKLLTGLYLPTGGRVRVGGCDSAETHPAALFAATSGVFQNYCRYKMTLRDNVSISSLREDAPAGGPLAEGVEDALRGADLDPAAEVFPQGEDTMLSREFEGIDLSGGQWQRVAIARGLYRMHDLIVLDEPTAAIDPIEETSIYRKFAEISKGRTAVLVTHRLGSARIADRIAVMDGGRVCEEGSHEELLSRGGKYAEMWEAQAQYYR